MHSIWQTIFQKALQTEEALIPIFLPDPSSEVGKILGAVVVTTSLFATIFGAAAAPAAPATPSTPAQ